MRNIISRIAAIAGVVSFIVSPSWAQRVPRGGSMGGTVQQMPQQQPQQNNPPRGNPSGGSSGGVQNNGGGSSNSTPHYSGGTVNTAPNYGGGTYNGGSNNSGGTVTTVPRNGGVTNNPSSTGGTGGQTNNGGSTTTTVPQNNGGTVVAPKPRGGGSYQTGPVNQGGTVNEAGPKGNVIPSAGNGVPVNGPRGNVQEGPVKGGSNQEGGVVKPPVIVRPVPSQTQTGGGTVSTGVQSMPRPVNLTAQQIVVTPKGQTVSTPRPIHGPGNQTITAQELPIGQLTHNTAVINNTVNNTTIINNITNNYYNETGVNQYYWHDYDGNHYCHYYGYDPYWGYSHWYGWYVGDYYYWTLWHGGYMWTYDSYYGRWVYWNNGNWWWQDPYQPQVVYIYVNSGYYQYQTTQTGTVVMQPEQNPKSGPSGNMAGQRLYYSKDGTRLVQVSGDYSDAFLYDTTDKPQIERTYLASDVKDVEFSDPQPGMALEIYLTIEKSVNGAMVKSMKTFNSYGQQYGAYKTGSIESPVGKDLYKTTSMLQLQNGDVSW